MPGRLLPDTLGQTGNGVVFAFPVVDPLLVVGVTGGLVGGAGVALVVAGGVGRAVRVDGVVLGGLVTVVTTVEVSWLEVDDGGCICGLVVGAAGMLRLGNDFGAELVVDTWAPLDAMAVPLSVVEQAVASRLAAASTTRAPRRPILLI